MNISQQRQGNCDKKKVKNQIEALAVTIYLSYFEETFCNKEKSESGKRKQRVLKFASGADMGILKANNF